MKRIRIVGLCLVAMFAMSAVAAASASASPTYKECVKVKAKTGKFASATCTTEGGTGTWELKSPTKGAYTATTKVATLETPGIGAVSCKTSKATGTITSETAGTTTVVFSACATEGKKCTSAGEKAGIIKTNLLSDSLREPTPGTVETVVTGTGPETISAEFSCETVSIKTKGSVGGVDSPINTSGKKSTQTFSAATGLETEFSSVPGVLFPSTQTATAAVATKGDIGIYTH